jgi:hypothetical protein
MAFTHQMVEVDILQLYQTLDEARRQTFYLYQAATQTQDGLAVEKLSEVTAKLSQANSELTDLKTKIERLKRESEAQAVKV